MNGTSGRLTFEEFCDRLPTSTRLQQASPVPPELDQLTDERPFVSPMLKAVLDRPQCAVVLIVARGAVGKTTLGRAIARKLRTDLWGLGAAQVGDRYLEGALAATYGDAQFSAVTSDLKNGTRAVVLDGLDEALLRAGAANFDGFLKSLATRFHQAGARPALVLLGRPLAMDRAWDCLVEHGVEVSYYEIDYFDDQAAKGFIDSYIERGKKRPQDANRHEFERARDSVLERLRGAVPDDVDPSSVIGYAPVLRLVAELLDVGNPHKVAEQVESWPPDELLAKVAERILLREQNEKVDQVPEYKRAGAWTVEEQCLRLLAKRADYTLQARLPKNLPEDLREEYDRRLDSWVTDHPFGSEQIFQEYVHAWLLRNGSAAEPALAAAVRHYLHSAQPPYRPTPLLLRFTSSLSQGTVVLDGMDFGFVYESALAEASTQKGRAETKERPPRLTLLSSDSDSDVVGELVFSTPGRTSRRRVSVHLDARKGVWFWRQLAWANIALAGEVCIGSGQVEFTLGPDVDLECEVFRCDSPVVRLSTPDDESQVVVEANGYAGEPSPQIVTYDNRIRLKVSWEGLNHPWSRYALTRDRVPPADKELFVKLRRILKPFRATVHFEDLSCAAALIDRITVGGLARDIVDYAERERLIKRTGDSYLLDTGVLETLGISWEDLSGRVVSPGINNFLAAFRKWRT